MTFHAAIDLAIRDTLEHRKQLWAQMISSDNFPELYVGLLLNTYHYVKQSCPLMRAAERLARERNLIELANYLERHTEEETDHDVWLLEDLEQLGVPKAMATNSLPSRYAAAMVGSQLFLMQEYTPLTLLGYIYVLEAYPPQAKALKWITERHGIPAEGLRTLLDHSDLDQEHRDDLIKSIDTLVVNPRDQELVTHSALIASEFTLLLLSDLWHCAERRARNRIAPG